MPGMAYVHCILWNFGFLLMEEHNKTYLPSFVVKV